MQSASDLARSTKGAIRNGAGWLIPCPLPSHGRGKGDRNPSLSIADGRDGRLLVTCYAGCDRAEILRALAGFGGPRGEVDEAAIAKAEEHAAAEAAKKRDAAVTIWRRAIPIGGTEAEQYLIGRGLTPPFPMSLRYAGSLRYRTGEFAPAMVAAVQAPDGSAMAVHRTFLRADASPRKMMLGAVMGGAVRLGMVDDTLALAEGIETALSVMEIAGVPAWACLSVAGMLAVQIPARVKRVIVAADHDLAGLRAARKIRDRLSQSGVETSMLIPTARGDDWNDVLQKRAKP